MRADVKSLLFDGFLLLLQMIRIVHSNKTKIFPILRRKKREQLLQKRKNCPRKTKVQLPLRLRRRKKEKKKRSNNNAEIDNVENKEKERKQKEDKEKKERNRKEKEKRQKILTE